MSNARIAKLQLTNIVVGNAPALGWIVSDNPIVSARLFSASGPPSETTLLAGNGRYCASTSGFVCNATLGAAGTAYAVGDVLTGAGGTASVQPQFTVDAVDAAGKILDFHCTQVGVYSVYPINVITPAGGSGSGATFNLALQAADFYLDSTANVLYVCTTSGTNQVGMTGGSAWVPISGGDTWQVPRELDPTVAVAQYTKVYISPKNPLVTVGLVDLDSSGATLQATAGIWQAMQNIPAATSAGYNVPQDPPPGSGTNAPSGSPLKGDLDGTTPTVKWLLIKSVC